jgi:glycosyltransferase involved in cell wall biosynthesis
VRLLLVGKYPPIEGGVSAQSYRFAHAMARLGHRIDVITNANEVEANFRMSMRIEDWEYRSGHYGAGAVRVFDTDAYGNDQRHIPHHNPFATKLAALGIEIGGREPLDGVFSFYLEPYSVAGHLIASALGVPHIVKTAGSDAGRLRHLDHFRPLYDHILRSAHRVLAGGVVAREMAAAGVAHQRIVADTTFVIPSEWADAGEPIDDMAALADDLRSDRDVGHLVWGNYQPRWPHFGMYGKFGRDKGTFDALRALARMKAEGRDAGLVYVGGGLASDLRQFETTAAELGIQDRVLRLPFLPYWRIPAFVRSCRAILYLEQDFHIAIHRPVVAREVLACGTLLIASTEILAKMPMSERLMSGYNCLAVRDAKSPDEVAAAMTAVLEEPAWANSMAARGQGYLHAAQARMSKDSTLESVIERVLSKSDVSNTVDATPTAALPAEQPNASTSERASAQPPFFRLGGGFGANVLEDLAGRVPRWIGTLEIEEPAADAKTPIFTIRQQAPWRAIPRLLSLDPFTACVLSQCNGTETVEAIGRALAETVVVPDVDIPGRADRAVRELLEHALVECG